MFRIRFFRTHDPYGCFSNFAEYPVTMAGKVWPTSAHYYQGQKYAGTVYEDVIRQAATPMEAVRLGKDKNRPLRPDWHLQKDAIMKEVTVAKFAQYPVLRAILLSTGDCCLLGYSTTDAYWSDGGDGSGRNRFAEILMELRENDPDYRPDFYLPQWLAYPNIAPFDTFWCKGEGKEYRSRFDQWFHHLHPEAKKEYDRYFIPPREWEGVNAKRIEEENEVKTQ